MTIKKILAVLMLAGLKALEGQAQPAPLPVPLPVPRPMAAQAPAQPMQAAPTLSAGQPIYLSSGKSHVIRLPSDARDVLVSNPEVAEVLQRSPRMAFLLARKVGSASVAFFDAAGRELAFYDVRVGVDLEGARDALRSAMPMERIEVSAAGPSLAISGSVTSATSAENARRIVRQFVSDDAQVMNLLSVRADSQVYLRVRVAEMSRQIVKELGIRGTSSIGSAADRSLSSSIGRANANAFGSLTGIFAFDAFDRISATLDALENSGQVKILAEPNLTAVSGESANFLAGGEFPIPIPQDNDTITIEYKQFGIRLTFTPVVSSGGLISLKIATEVSQLTNQGEVILAGFRIPALTVRRAETTVEMPSGGSIAIAGLLQNDIRNRVNGFPLLKDIPILGELFKSSNFQKDETDLVITVSPLLVRPVAPNALSLPTDGFTSAPDAQRYGQGEFYRIDPQNAPPEQQQPLIIPPPRQGNGG